jgi:PAS domain S-box-containing protein
VSLQRQAARELAARTESDERFRAVWEATSEALALSDPNGEVLAVNPAYCALYGRSADEFVGRSFAVIFGGENQSEAMALYQAVYAATEPPRSYEARIWRPDGSERVVEARADFLIRDGQRVAMVSAIRDITERKRLDQAQLDFVAMASHDLASPLTVLRARAQLLQRRQRYEEESVTAILEQTNRMGRLINDLRELVQVEGGGLTLQLEIIDLGALAQVAVDRARTLSKTHAVRVEDASVPVFVLGDHDRLGQVLDNLISNAIKYSQPDGEILVRTELVDGEARVSVIDQGTGIPPDALPSLFDRFYRGPNSAGEAGLGLGLYITRMLVEAHGGRIWATSEEGRGSTFTAALPYHSGPPGPANAPESVTNSRV